MESFKLNKEEPVPEEGSPRVADGGRENFHDVGGKLLQMLQTGEIRLEVPPGNTPDAPGAFERSVDTLVSAAGGDLSSPEREQVKRIGEENHGLEGVFSAASRMPSAVKRVLLAGVVGLSLLAPFAARPSKAEAGGRYNPWTQVAVAGSINGINNLIREIGAIERERIRQQGQQNRDQMRGYEIQAREETRRQEIEARERVELARIEAGKQAMELRLAARLEEVKAQVKRDELRSSVELRNQENRLTAELARTKNAEKIALINARVQGIREILKTRDTASVNVEETATGMKVEKSDTENK